MMHWFDVRLAAGLVGALAISACTPAATTQPTTNAPAVAAPRVPAKPSSKTYALATPEAGSDIPAATVKFGMRPYADNTYFVVGMEKGWFKDVGITVDPAPYGLKTTEEQWVSLLLNHQVGMHRATCSIVLTSYKTTDQLKCIGLAVTFYGQVMRANPNLGVKTST